MQGSDFLNISKVSINLTQWIVYNVQTCMVPSDPDVCIRALARHEGTVCTRSAPVVSSVALIRTNLSLVTHIVEVLLRVAVCFGGSLHPPKDAHQSPYKVVHIQCIAKGVFEQHTKFNITTTITPAFPVWHLARALVPWGVISQNCLAVV